MDNNILEFIKNFLDFKVKFSLPILIAIVAIAQAIKMFDKKKKIDNRYYTLIVFILGLIGGTLVIPGEIAFSTVLSYGMAHAGAASFLYQFRKYILPGSSNVFGLGAKK